MLDKIRTLNDLGRVLNAQRRKARKPATEIARHAGRSRDILYRAERGEGITTGALLDLLRAMGLAISIVPAGMPTLEEMRERFADLEDEDNSP